MNLNIWIANQKQSVKESPHAISIRPVFQHSHQQQNQNWRPYLNTRLCILHSLVQWPKAGTTSRDGQLAHETGPALLTTARVLWARTRQRHGRDDSKDRRNNSSDFAESSTERPNYTKASSQQRTLQQTVQQEKWEATLKHRPCKLDCTSILKAQTNYNQVLIRTEEP